MHKDPWGRYVQPFSLWKGLTDSYKLEDKESDLNQQHI